jgi:hypothetical protein
MADIYNVGNSRSFLFNEFIVAWRRLSESMQVDCGDVTCLYFLTVQKKYVRDGAYVFVSTATTQVTFVAFSQQWLTTRRRIVW